MAITRKHSQTAPAANNTSTHNTHTAIPTICIDVNEMNNNNYCNNNNFNNNNLGVTHTNGKHGVLNCLPDIFTDIDLNGRNGLNGHYLKDDLYKPYIIGKFFTHPNPQTYTHSLEQCISISISAESRIESNAFTK